MVEIQIICGDTLYDIDESYKQGALACRSGHSWNWIDYYPNSEEADQWQAGYSNEEADEHFRFGIDIITTEFTEDYTFQEDPDVPRDKNGNVDWSDHENLFEIMSS